MGEVELERVRVRPICQHRSLDDSRICASCADSMLRDIFRLTEKVERLRNRGIVARALVGPLVEDLRSALRAYLNAQCRMLERWAEGDEAVKRELWQALHACEEAGRAALHTEEPL